MARANPPSPAVAIAQELSLRRPRGHCRRMALVSPDTQTVTSQPKACTKIRK